MDNFQEKFTYSPISIDEQKKLAIALLAENVFTSQHILEHDIDLLSSIFMPFGLGMSHDLETLEDMSKISPVFYEYMPAACGRVNNYPTFMSMKIISWEDFEKVIALTEQLKEVLNKYG